MCGKQGRERGRREREWIDRRGEERKEKVRETGEKRGKEAKGKGKEKAEGREKREKRRKEIGERKKSIYSEKKIKIRELGKGRKGEVLRRKDWRGWRARGREMDGGRDMLHVRKVNCRKLEPNISYKIKHSQDIWLSIIKSCFLTSYQN